jgi:protocatechuate 3,4-dioxygenase beta subunit
MKWLSALCLSLVLGIFAAAQKEPPKDSKTPKEDQCTISGLVVTLAASAPLKKARIVLQSADDPKQSVSTITTADGRFTLRKIEPGPYRLSVSRPGYVNQAYGQRKPDSPGAVLTLQPRQEMKDLLFRMIPAGVISGKVYDEDGEALPNVYIQALKQKYSDGKRQLSSAVRVQTNDLGEYRLHGLAPGRYFVSAAYPRWGRYGDQEEDVPSDDSQDQGYAKLYYPGTPDSSKATPITVKSGEEISSMEILMRPVPVHVVRGHVYNQITQKKSESIQVALVPKTSHGEWDSFAGATAKPDGSFTIQEVLTGSYVLMAYWFDGERFYINRFPLEVASSDIDGVSVTLTPSMNIPGRIVWEGKPSVQNDELSIDARSTDLPFYAGRGQVDKSADFTLKNLSDGPFRINITNLPNDSYIKQVRYGDATSAAGEFTITRGEVNTLEITLSARGARVQGIVTGDDGLPSSGVSVVLIPEATKRDQFQLYKTVNTDQYGHFDLRGIAPGDYKIFSWEEVEADSWQDPEFLKPFESKGESVTLHDDDRKKMNVTVIRAGTTENASSQ